MRVIAGSAKGIPLKGVPGKGTRPITDRVKEAVFNIISWRIPEARFLDLFAGTGGVGIEALSRGAAEATFVERNARVARVIRENLRATNLADRARVVVEDVFTYLERFDEQPYDIVYVAPPQYKGLWADTLRVLDRKPVVDEDGVVIVQIFPKEFEPLPLQRLTLTDQRRYGSTLLCFYVPEG